VGTGLRTLTHGRWKTWCRPWDPSSGYTTSVLGNYAYRNQAVVAIERINATDLCSIAYTRPKITIQYNQPPFKTQKLLSGRALVADSFARGFGYRISSNLSTQGSNSLTVLQEQAGFGFYAHRDGYNVLYGDHSVRWYGDPDQRLMYWPQATQGYYQNGLWTTSNYAQIGTYVYAPNRELGLPLAWHQMDMANHVDVDAPLD
jgi:hypothetical protein